MLESPFQYVEAAPLGFNLRELSAEAASTLFANQLRSLLTPPVLKTHDIPSRDFDSLADALPEAKLFTISRNFKDVFISRYFYARYHWETSPHLGARPEHLNQALAPLDHLSDGDALSALIPSPLLSFWARNWAAFETKFSTRDAIRITYEDMLSGAHQWRLEEFTGRQYVEPPSFLEFQDDESVKHGRFGHARFNRVGRHGQWKDWFTNEQSAIIDSIALSAREEEERLRENCPR